MYRGRFAPSPTGDLHLGSVATALFSLAAARRVGGRVALRIEDLDPPRVVPGSEHAQLDDLAWLGLRFDEGPREGGPVGPYRQSERLGLYEAALDVLARRGLTYLCDCSRADIARVASAPHEGDEGPRYPGTCREHGHVARAFRRPPAVRLAVPPGEVAWLDSVAGRRTADVSAATGDFVLRRGDGVFAYQLAVVVDDVTMGVTEVVRGVDLLPSAARQTLLARLLGADPPRYLHVPMLVGPSGNRLAKRAGGATVARERAAGRSPAEILAEIAALYGHPVSGGGDPVAELAAAFDPSRFPGSAVVRRPAAAGVA